MQMADWQGMVVRMLVNAGTVGVLQNQLQNRACRYADGRTVVAYLHTLWAEGKVQHFELTSTRGPPGKWWRATTKIMETQNETHRTDRKR